MKVKYPNTKALIEALSGDVWPSPAVCVDFGIPPVPDGKNCYGLYGLLQWGFKMGLLQVEELDAACCKGPALTAIVKRMQSEKCPYGEYIEKIEVPWDNMPTEEEEED